MVMRRARPVQARHKSATSQAAALTTPSAKILEGNAVLRSSLKLYPVLAGRSSIYGSSLALTESS